MSFPRSRSGASPATNEGLLWRPSTAFAESSNLRAFERFAAKRTGHSFDDYADLWRWSQSDLEGFWSAIWEFTQIDSSSHYSEVLAGGDRSMPGAKWFPGARLNYAEHVLRHEDRSGPALIYASESRAPAILSWQEYTSQVRTLATRLREIGVRPGDRVCAYLPNVPQAMVAMLAATSIGAVWAMVSPEMGSRGALDRLQQLHPKVLFFVQGYEYGGEYHDRTADVAAVMRGLTGLEAAILVGDGGIRRESSDRLTMETFEGVLDGPSVGSNDFRFEEVPFDHPLWVLFSSGTTGPPKAIVHGHGGITIEHMKVESLHMNLQPGDRVLWYTSTNWMTWTFLASMPALGAVPILYDGSPIFPETDAMWALAEAADATFMGTSPGYIGVNDRAEIVPRQRYDLSNLKTILPAGAPVTADHGLWLYSNVSDDFWLATSSGGTDCCTAFVGGIPTLPVYAGEIQGRCLGVSVHAFDADGRPVVGEVGELVVTEPMPSMPLRFWGDEEGRRLRETYFSHFKGAWRHGDLFLVNSRGGTFVLGRSDATLNRQGIRIGTSEIYRALNSVPDVEDAIVVNLESDMQKSSMVLFVKLKSRQSIDVDIEARIRDVLREYSPRHVPDRIVPVSDIPLTLTGKKMEVPVRRLLEGVPVEEAVNINAMKNPESLKDFVEYVARQKDYGT